MEVDAANFETRKQLDTHIQGIADKTGYSIRGTRAILARLGLSDLRNVFGVPCVITDTPTPARKMKVLPDRGARTPFGINLQNKNK